MALSDTQARWLAASLFAVLAAVVAVFILVTVEPIQEAILDAVGAGGLIAMIGILPLIHSKGRITSTGMIALPMAWIIVLILVQRLT